MLLHRTGATRRQLLTMTAVEALLAGATAIGVGTFAVAPAVLGVSYGLLGVRLPVMDVRAYAVSAAGVVLLALVATALAARRATRTAA